MAHYLGCNYCNRHANSVEQLMIVLTLCPGFACVVFSWFAFLVLIIISIVESRCIESFGSPFLGVVQFFSIFFVICFTVPFIIGLVSLVKGNLKIPYYLTVPCIVSYLVGVTNIVLFIIYKCIDEDSGQNSDTTMEQP